MADREVLPETGDGEDVYASGAYWREYYNALGHENREVGDFLLEATGSLPAGDGLRILDAGCGPTLLYWAVFAVGWNKVHGFDLNPASISDNRRRIDEARRGVVDAGLVEAAAHAIRVLSATVTPEQLVADKAAQVQSLKVADLSKPWPYAAEQFDLVQSCFAMESLPDWTSFDAALAEARRVLRPGGSLALVNGSQGTGWICDAHHFPTLFVTERDLGERLERHGLLVRSTREVDSTDPNWRTQGYNRILLTRATKPGQPATE